MNPSSPSDAPVLATAALLGTPPRRRRWLRISVWLLLAAGLAFGTTYAWQQREGGGQKPPQYVSQPVQRGDIRLTVMANGSLQPTRSVSIGSELSGTVSEVLVDVNDRVKKGQVLVTLETSKLRAQLERSRAALASSQARLDEVRATLAEAGANLKRLQEVQRLSGGKVPAQAELDVAEAALARARASEKAAIASVQDNRAAVATHEADLAKASIVSPMDGVVLTRAVEPGYAVAASLQAVTLFTLAEDLAQLRLDVSVDEADVGSVRPGQSASFTVSAWPGRNYPATVERVAYGSTITDNVVTYTTRLDVDNHDLSLRPGMTASATIVATEQKDVLLVPNAALRFSPPAAGGDSARRGPSASKSAGKSTGGGGLVSQLMPRPRSPQWRRARDDAQDSPTASALRQVWMEQDGQLMPLRVQTGISDGRMTEVSGENIREGMQVVVDQRSAAGR